MDRGLDTSVQWSRSGAGSRPLATGVHVAGVQPGPRSPVMPTGRAIARRRVLRHIPRQTRLGWKWVVSRCRIALEGERHKADTHLSRVSPYPACDLWTCDLFTSLEHASERRDQLPSRALIIAAFKRERMPRCNGRSGKRG